MLFDLVYRLPLNLRWTNFITVLQIFVATSKLIYFAVTPCSCFVDAGFLFFKQSLIVEPISQISKKAWKMKSVCFAQSIIWIFWFCFYLNSLLCLYRDSIANLKSLPGLPDGYMILQQMLTFVCIFMLSLQKI